MRKQATFALLLVATTAVYAACQSRGFSTTTPGSTRGGDIQVLFSPRGGCTGEIVKCIGATRRLIRIQAYSFTSRPIAEALVAAIKRGVKVQALLDRSNRTDKYSSATFLRNSGAEVWIDARHAIAHSKVMLLDDSTVITGSFNFTRSAEEANAENLLIIRDRPDVMSAYVANWDAHVRHAERYGQDSARTGTKKRAGPSSGQTARRP